MTLPTQTIAAGAAGPDIANALNRLSRDQFYSRLWSQDPTLWGSRNGDGRLGWLSIVPVMSQHAAALRRVAEDLRQAGYTRAVVLGMGGSSLFPEVCASLFGAAPGFLPLSIIDTTDPAAIRAHETRDALERLCVIASSKSGTTLETRTLLRYFHDALKRVSRNPGAQCLAITDCDTPLEHDAEALRFRKVFTHGCGTGAEVGGRYSAMTFFGLVPAALLGVDPERLLNRAAKMQAACAPDAAPGANPGLQLGAALGALALAGRNKLTLLTSGDTAAIGPWIEQLIAESTGKQGKGIVPVHGEPRRAPKAYGADRVFVELQTAKHPDTGLAALADALTAAGHPVIRIRWQDAYDLGAEAAKWFIATAIVGYLLDVNPLDEPDVQSSKDSTQAVLRQFQRDHAWPKEGEVASDVHMSVFGTGSRLASPKDAFAGLFQPRGQGEYLAVLSFLPRSQALDRRLADLRGRLGEWLGCATMLQFGPRYLHSTGQLFKGGTSQGRFLLLTGDESEDLPIPGETYTFGQLKRAQALGDVSAMQQKGRRVLHVHLRGGLDEALAHCAGLLEQAAA